MSQSGEQELLQRARAGDPDAMGELLTQHQGRLYNICLRMVGNADDAAELTQDVLVQVLQKLGDFRGDSQVGTWMTRIAMNRAISFLRKQGRRGGGRDGKAGQVSLDTSSNGHAGQDEPRRLQLVDHREPSPTSRVQEKEAIAGLQQAIASLEPEFRAVLILRDIDGQDYQQIADSLGLAVGTVKSRLFRARLALRESLRKAEREGRAWAGEDVQA